MKEDIHRFAVSFNNEYIGEANSFKVVKGKNDEGIEVMPTLEIKGDYQAKNDKEVKMEEETTQTEEATESKEEEKSEESAEETKE